MTDPNGWIRLHRQIQLNPLWKERRKFSKAEAWIDMLMEARHSEESAQILIGTRLIECGRGQIIKSMETWARRWNWSKPSVNRYFDLLSRMNQIRKENVTKTTRITICNYALYNPLRNDCETIVKRSRNASETQVKPNNNVENEKNEKNERKTTGGFSESFLTFWNAYPRKVGKKTAWKAFQRADDKPPIDELVAEVKAQAGSQEWTKDGGAFIPHPATWLNRGGWEDYLTAREG